MTHPALKDLQRIPGVGPAITANLFDIGIRAVDDLRGQDPEQLYQRLSQQVGKPVDRCVLYVFHCAVYFAENTVHDPQLLKWWHWKDRP